MDKASDKSKLEEALENNQAAKDYVPIVQQAISEAFRMVVQYGRYYRKAKTNDNH